MRTRAPYGCGAGSTRRRRAEGERRRAARRGGSPAAYRTEPPESPCRAGCPGDFPGGKAACGGGAGGTGSGAGAGRSPRTSSSSVTPNTPLNLTSLSRSGTELSVSHLEMDWRRRPERRPGRPGRGSARCEAGGWFRQGTSVGPPLKLDGPSIARGAQKVHQAAFEISQLAVAAAGNRRMEAPKIGTLQAEDPNPRFEGPGFLFLWKRPKYRAAGSLE